MLFIKTRKTVDDKWDSCETPFTTRIGEADQYSMNTFDGTVFGCITIVYNQDRVLKFGALRQQQNDALLEKWGGA